MHAIILHLEDEFEVIKYEETDNYMIMKEVINNPKKMLNILMEPYY
ncbi:hypothetical protein [Clostridium ganghwense]